MIMQDSDLSGYTNASTLWNQCGLDQRYHALWHLDWPETSDAFWPDPVKYIKSTKSYQTAKKIFIVGQEGWASNILDTDPRFYIWEPVLGINHPRFHPYLFWFDWSRIVASDMCVLDKLLYASGEMKPYHFDCLLGKSRIHRDFIYNKAKTSNGILLTYQNKTSWAPGSDLDQSSDEHTDSQLFVDYKDQSSCNLAVVVPWQIYNRSWFTIVAETDTDKIFLTEKTAKPLLARRLFVWFGAKQGLKYMRDLGFKTFDNVIDESYDDIDDDQIRWSQAWAQVEYLLLQDPKIIYSQIHDRLVHNQTMMITTDHYKKLVDQIKANSIV